MECLSCGANDFARPQARAAMEIWRCKNCGTEAAFHCDYPLSMPRRSVFLGTAHVESRAQALKAMLKLKKALAFAERFSASRLEEQHRKGQLTWELGYFLDFELERAKAECSLAGVSSSFKEI